MKANPRTVRRWPVGTRVRVRISGATGEVVRVLGMTSGSGAIRVRWDEPKFGCESSVVSNPDMRLEKLS